MVTAWTGLRCQYSIDRFPIHTELKSFRTLGTSWMNPQLKEHKYVSILPTRKNFLYSMAVLTRRILSGNKSCNYSFPGRTHCTGIWHRSYIWPTQLHINTYTSWPKLLEISLRWGPEPLSPVTRCGFTLLLPFYFRYWNFRIRFGVQWPAAFLPF